MQSWENRWKHNERNYFIIQKKRWKIEENLEVFSKKYRSDADVATKY